MHKEQNKYWPLFLAITLILGIILGYKFSTVNSATLNTNLSSFKSTNKSIQTLNEVVTYIDKEYVDTIDQSKMIEETIHTMLQNLDPHSYYIPPAEVAAMNEPLEGNFDGIGVEFNITDDTIIVVNPLSGGPSELVGIRAGDRIITVDGEVVAGIGVTNRMVMDKLRGERGTEVNIQVVRNANNKAIPYTIIRDKIPLNSIDIGYLITPSTGYIKVSRFAKNTHQEFMQNAKKLIDEGMQNLILDLRNNGGGYMDAAINICDEFLDNNKLIVYTNGRSRARKEYHATSKGELHNVPIIILLNENSASASEIVAGAIQDNDRGTLVGRRSFGKGLVQEQSNWPDGSAIRLTIARYYTPSGRCIQKPYENGVEDYYEDYYDRIESGELVNKDSVKTIDSLKYFTTSGRLVFGGGGILPDSFVAIDTNSVDQRINTLIYEGKVRRFAFNYVDSKREQLTLKYKTAQEFNSKFNVSYSLVNQFFKSVKVDGKITKESSGYEFLCNRIKAQIGRYLWSSESFYPILNKQDPVIKKTLQILES
jgi:carboxyl-terminal processing protease